MKKILVATDLQRDARPGMRFAIQLSQQQKARLLFTHVLHISRLTRWSDEQYQAFQASERASSKHKLEQMVADVYARMGVTDGDYECRLIEGVFAEPTLLDYCHHHPDIDLICMSTLGAAGINKLFGTHAGNIVANSSIPVVVVPKGYRARPVTRILYATDLVNYEEELQKVAALAGTFKAELDILHIIRDEERIPNKGIFEKVLSEEFRYPVRIHFPIEDETRSMAVNLQQQIRAIRPSLAVLFTDQDRTIFEKVFLSSKSERIAFATTVPLMVFPKKAAVIAKKELEKDSRF